jgi:hypothetical protein
MPITYDSARDLQVALRRAAEAHGHHEEQTGQADPDWPDWYAHYMERDHNPPLHNAAPGTTT